MLTRLSINNLAIIENVDVTFKNGFTVLTGGTGAGKSLLIDSLSLLFGERASSELIRQGESKATVKGYFTISNNRLSAALTNLNIPFVNNEFTITRTISASKNTIKINETLVSLAELKTVSKNLANIHNQFDFEKILNPENYLSIIDGFSYEMINSQKSDYYVSYSKYKNAKSEYEALIQKKSKFDEGRDFYEYQYNELKNANLEEGEEERIDEEISLLKNYDNVYSLANEAESIIREDFLDRLYELNKVLAKLSSYQNKYQEAHDKLDERYYEIDDIFSNLKKEFHNIDFDPNRLNDLESRSSDLASLKRKYRKSLPELITYRDELSTVVGKDSPIVQEIEDKKEELKVLFGEVYQKGEELSKLRKQVASSIESELEKNMEDLLLKARFQVSFRPYRKEDGDSLFKEDGLDEVDFLIETNTGEGLKSLSKIISGGEASRIMLAFKAILIKANKVGTVVFDEIDTGISGEAAEAVAKKIHDISLISQVIAITHMPQVASYSDHDIKISKEVKEGRTYTHTKELTLEEKIHEIAELISGSKVTEKQLEYAKEMVFRNRS